MQIALAIFQYVILLMCLAMWAYRLLAKRRTGELLSLRQHDVSPIGGVDIFATVMIWFVMSGLAFHFVPIVRGLKNFIGEEANPAAMLEFTGWIMLFQLATSFFAAAFFLLRHRRVTWLGQSRTLARDLLIGFVAALMLIPLVMLIQLVVTQLIPYTHPTIDSLKENFSGATAIWASIAAVGVAPLTEEFFFRGLIQGWLQRTFDYDEPKEKWVVGGKVTPNSNRETPNELPFQKQYRFWAPIFITSVLFAAVHAGQGPAPIPLFVLAIGLGYLFRKTGSFIPCVIVHVILNSLSLTLLALGIMYPELMPVEAEPAGAILFW